MRYACDADGRIISWTDRNDTTYWYAYDSQGRMVATGGNGNALALRHRAPSHRGEHPQRLSRNYVYDPSGQLIAETGFDDRTVTYAHDGAGQLTACADALGPTTRFERDMLGQVTPKTAVDQVTAFKYAPVGQRATATTVEATLLRTYDAAGRLLSETVNNLTVRTNTSCWAAVRGARHLPGPSAAGSYDGRPGTEPSDRHHHPGPLLR